jgi:hypothetical protein
MEKNCNKELGLWTVVYNSLMIIMLAWIIGLVLVVVC